MANGLSSASFVDGAMKGANFVSGMQSQQQARSLRDAHEQRAQERHSEMAQDREEARGHRNEQREAWQEDRKAAKEAQSKEAENALILSSLVASKYVDQGKLSQDELSLMEKYPLADVKHLQSKEMGDAIGIFKGIMDGSVQLPKNEKGMIDLSNNPEIADALMALDPRLSSGNKDGKKVRPRLLIPSADGKTLQMGLDVDGDGKVRPLTKNRSSADDDEVMEISLEDLINSAMAAEKARDLTSKPEYYQYLAESRGLLKPSEGQAGELQQHPDLGWIQEQRDGTYKQYSKEGEQGRAQSDPTAYRLAKLLQAEAEQAGAPITFDQAWQKSKLSATDPAKFISQHVADGLKNQRTTQDGELMTKAELEAEAIRDFKRYREIGEELQQGGSTGLGSAQGIDGEQGQAAAQAAGQDFDPNSFLDGFGVPAGQ